MQALEDNYEKTLQDETKELEQLFSRRNALIAKQDEYSKKIRNLGPLSSDAFETYVPLSNFVNVSIFVLYASYI